MCINANNWLQKLSIVFIQSLNLALLTLFAVCSLTNCRLHLGRFWMRSNNHCRLSIGHSVQVSSTKLYPLLLLLGSSNKSFYSIVGTSCLSVANMISINCFYVVLYNWLTMLQNCAMLKWMSLYYKMSLFYQLTWPWLVVLNNTFMLYALKSNIHCIRLAMLRTMNASIILLTH